MTRHKLMGSSLSEDLCSGWRRRLSKAMAMVAERTFGVLAAQWSKCSQLCKNLFFSKKNLSDQCDGKLSLVKMIFSTSCLDWYVIGSFDIPSIQMMLRFARPWFYICMCVMKPLVSICIHQRLVFLYHRHPWPGMDNTWTAIFHIAKASSGPPIPEGITEVIEDFLSRCFQLDPRKRPTSTEVSSIILLYLRCFMSNHFIVWSLWNRHMVSKPKDCLQ